MFFHWHYKRQWTSNGTNLAGSIYIYIYNYVLYTYIVTHILLIQYNIYLYIYTPLETMFNRKSQFSTGSFPWIPWTAQKKAGWNGCLALTIATGQLCPLRYCCLCQGYIGNHKPQLCRKVGKPENWLIKQKNLYHPGKYVPVFLGDTM